ncbi:MAG: ATP-dependent DNA ligase [Candidatus Bathyarchaeota archaeon]|nr:ATP-dependent DNA ligase [Candidatus Bathyarchaeota archaeon]
MTETKFKELAQLCKNLEATTKRKEKTALISDFLKGINRDEIKPAILLTIGAVFPETSDKTLDVGWRTLKRVMDRGGQTTLFRHQLTVKEVYNIMQQIAKASGEGSRKQKEQLLERMFAQAEPLESEILARIIFGEMRIGVNEGMMLEGIAETTETDPALVRRALMMTGDIGKVAETAVEQGEAGLLSLEATLFVPLKPMLANTAETPMEALEDYGGEAVFEYKYDGARIQIHRKGDEVRVFSRRLSDVTESIPDIVGIVKEFPEEKDFIIEGEVVAVGENKRPLPFQDLMRRFTRVNEVTDKAEEIPLHLHLFDALYYDGKLLIDEPYSHRWSILEKIAPQKYHTQRIITTNPQEAEEFMTQAIEAGHEGLMAKRLDSSYSPGARGKNWYKLKPVETLDVVIVAADWGSGRRRGWLSNYHLGVWNGEEYLVIGKTFKGLTDEEFKWMTEHLQELRVRESEYTVYVKPELVVEVAFNEIQQSPHYKSGYALRFARITRIRTDKSPDEANTLQDVSLLYERQFKYKDKLNG